MKPDAARILIVDDEPDNREVLEIVLEWEGFAILTAASGEEALVMVAQHLPDLILLDVMMPGINGYEVAARIKGSLATRSIPIMMLTAMDDQKSRMLGLADDFLRKPYDRLELCLRVKNLLRPSGLRDLVTKLAR